MSVGPSRGRALSGFVSCVRCGGALVVGSGAESCTHVVRVCAHDSGTDHIDHNSWKHGPMDGCTFVDTVLGRAALAQYLRRAPEGTKVEAWEGRIFTCSRPVTWDV